MQKDCETEFNKEASVPSHHLLTGSRDMTLLSHGGRKEVVGAAAF